MFDSKLEEFDQIEGYTGEKDSLYERSIVVATDSKGAKTVCYMYHVTNSTLPEHDESTKVPQGDWLRRKNKSNKAILNILKGAVAKTKPSSAQPKPTKKMATDNGLSTNSDGKQITK